MQYFMYACYLLFAISFGINAVLFNDIPKKKRLFIPLMFFSGVFVASLIHNFIGIENVTISGLVNAIVIFFGAVLSTFFLLNGVELINNYPHI